MPELDHRIHGPGIFLLVDPRIASVYSELKGWVNIYIHRDIVHNILDTESKKLGNQPYWLRILAPTPGHHLWGISEEQARIWMLKNGEIDRGLYLIDGIFLSLIYQSICTQYGVMLRSASTAEDDCCIIDSFNDIDHMNRKRAHPTIGVPRVAMIC